MADVLVETLDSRVTLLILAVVGVVRLVDPHTIVHFASSGVTGDALGPLVQVVVSLFHEVWSSWMRGAGAQAQVRGFLYCTVEALEVLTIASLTISVLSWQRLTIEGSSSDVRASTERVVLLILGGFRSAEPTQTACLTHVSLRLSEYLAHGISDIKTAYL